MRAVFKFLPPKCLGTGKFFFPGCNPNFCNEIILEALLILVIKVVTNRLKMLHSALVFNKPILNAINPKMSATFPTLSIQGKQFKISLKIN